MKPRKGFRTSPVARTLATHHGHHGGPHVQQEDQAVALAQVEDAAARAQPGPAHCRQQTQVAANAHLLGGGGREKPKFPVEGGNLGIYIPPSWPESNFDLDVQVCI